MVKTRLCKTLRRDIFCEPETLFHRFPLMFSKFETLRLLIAKNETSRPAKFCEALTFCGDHSTRTPVIAISWQLSLWTLICKYKMEQCFNSENLMHCAYAPLYHWRSRLVGSNLIRPYNERRDWRSPYSGDADQNEPRSVISRLVSESQNRQRANRPTYGISLLLLFFFFLLLLLLLPDNWAQL